MCDMSTFYIIVGTYNCLGVVLKIERCLAMDFLDLDLDLDLDLEPDLLRCIIDLDFDFDLCRWRRDIDLVLNHGVGLLDVEFTIIFFFSNDNDGGNNDCLGAVLYTAVSNLSANCMSS